MSKEREKVSIEAILPDDKYKWVCIDCGSEDVEEKIWASVNDYIIINRTTYASISDGLDDDYYCNNCKELCQLDRKE